MSVRLCDVCAAMELANVETLRVEIEDGRVSIFATRHDRKIGGWNGLFETSIGGLTVASTDNLADVILGCAGTICGPESPVAGCGRTRVQRLLHPETVEDYGLSVTLGEFLADPEGRREFARFGAFRASHNVPVSGVESAAPRMSA